MKEIVVQIKVALPAGKECRGCNYFEGYSNEDHLQPLCGLNLGKIVEVAGRLIKPQSCLDLTETKEANLPDAVYGPSPETAPWLRKGLPAAPHEAPGCRNCKHRAITRGDVYCVKRAISTLPSKVCGDWEERSGE